MKKTMNLFYASCSIQSDMTAIAGYCWQGIALGELRLLGHK